MNLKQFLLLLIPSALWGSSFMFMHHLSPVFGPVLTATIRIIVASIALLIFLQIQNESMDWKKNYKLYALIGVMNSAIPFSLYAYAALYIPSSLSVIINSTSPMFGAMFGIFILKDKMSLKTAIGLLLGTIGVGFVSSDILATNSLELVLSILACIIAALLYGLSGALVKKSALHINPKQLTTGTLSFAGLFLFILVAILSVMNGLPVIESNNLTMDILLIILFGIICTSIPYIVYYKLLQEVGPVNALMVTYLMPIFGIIWGIIGGEIITVYMMVGLLIILSGIYVVNYQKKEEKL